MYEPEPLPTFRNNKDRAIYLLAEYKIPITIMLVAAGVWASYFRPEIPNPPEATRYFTLSWAILAMPSWIIGEKFVDWLYSPDTVLVGLVDGGEGDEVTVYEVPPDVWAEADVTGPPPYSPENGVDYVVWDFEWFEDTGTLSIHGVPRGRDDMEEWEQYHCKKRIDSYWTDYQELKRNYAELKTVVGDKLTDVHDLTIMEMLAKSQDAQVSTDLTVTDIVEQIEGEAGELDEQNEPGEIPGREPASMGDPEVFEPGQSPAEVATDGGNTDE